MKKFYLLLLGAMFMTTANAQTGTEGYVLDSVITTDADNVRWSKEVNEYNAKKQCVATYDYTYYGGVAELSEKYVKTYDANGRLTKEETYEYEDGQATLTYVEEVLEHNDAGEITSYVTKSLDEDNPAAGLQNYAKLVAKTFWGKKVEKFDYFLWNGADWKLIGYLEFKYNDNGTIKQQTLSADMEEEGETYTVWMVNTYEYDSHKNVTKETEKTSLPSFGFIISESETTYVNEYDALGNPVKITGTTTSKYGTDVDIQHLYWSTGSASVDAITAAMKKGKGIFDLNGRKMNMPFSRKGIYVVDGRKVFVK